MSLREEVELYSKLTGKDGTREPIVRIGAYLDGYEKGKEDAEPHWIPVEQDTPTEDDDYWCTFDAETGRFVDWCSWYQGRWVVWTDNTVSEVRNVIAWCKPMEPYKGGDRMSRKIKDIPISPLLDKVIPIEANMPHKVSEVICVKCGKRWISVRPKDTLLKDIVCMNCGCGYVIETGEEMREVTE